MLSLQDLKLRTLLPQTEFNPPPFSARALPLAALYNSNLQPALPRRNGSPSKTMTCLRQPFIVATVSVRPGTHGRGRFITGLLGTMCSCVVIASASAVLSRVVSVISGSAVSVGSECRRTVGIGSAAERLVWELELDVETEIEATGWVSDCEIKGGKPS